MVGSPRGLEAGSADAAPDLATETSLVRGMLALHGRERLDSKTVRSQLADIARDLGLSEFGVRYHLRKLFAKLGARKRAEAVRRAREMGLVPADS